MPPSLKPRGVFCWNDVTQAAHPSDKHSGEGSVLEECPFFEKMVKREIKGGLSVFFRVERAAFRRSIGPPGT